MISKIKKDSKGRNLKANEDQLKDGRYRYRYTDKYGKRHSVYSWRLVTTDKIPKGKRDNKCLREKEQEIERDLGDNIDVTLAKELTVTDLIWRYLETKVKLANSTINNYTHMTKKNIENSNFGNLRVCDVKKSDIQMYYAYLYKKRGFAAGTIQLYQNLIFPAFQMAVDDDLIRKNPCKSCMKDYSPGGLTSSKKPLTREEQKVLLDYVKNSKLYDMYYVMIATMLSTGCRIGEIIGMTWDNIDFEKATLLVDHQIIYKRVKEEGVTRHYASEPKNGTSRVIPLKPDILAILKKYKMQTYFMSKSNKYEVDGYSTFVFLNSNMRLHMPNTLTRAFHNIQESYNREREEDDIELPEFSAHTFRHTFCTRMAENGIDIKVLQNIMGHKTIAVTMQVYNHVLEERSLSEVNRVESALVV